MQPQSSIWPNPNSVTQSLFYGYFVSAVLGKNHTNKRWINVEPWTHWYWCFSSGLFERWINLLSVMREQFSQTIFNTKMNLAMNHLIRSKGRGYSHILYFKMENSFLFIELTLMFWVFRFLPSISLNKLE